MAELKPSCLHVTCGCPGNGDQAFCSDYCEKEHVDNVIEVESCECGHEGCSKP